MIGTDDMTDDLHRPLLRRPASGLRLPADVPHAATAQRPDWGRLPAAVREWVEARLGAAVRDAVSQRSGYTPGFASRLELVDGRRCFVKIADSGHDWLVRSYADEVAKRRLLPAGVAAPELRDSATARLDGRDWLMAVFADVAGGPPRRPWSAGQIRAAIRAVETSARYLDPAPQGYPWQPISAELGGLSEDKQVAIARHFPGHAAEMQELVAAFADRCTGSALVHADLRDDNLIIDGRGRGWICDWNFPMLGRSWIDLVTVLISVRADGWDADAVLASSPLLGPGDADRVDSLLADLGLYYLIRRDAPGPDNSPHLRAHQAHSAAVVCDWLAERRGWQGR